MASSHQRTAAKDVQLGPPRERLPGSQAVDCASSLAEAFNVPKAIMQQSQLAARTWENIQQVKARQNRAKGIARRAQNGRQSPGILSYRGRHGSDHEDDEDDGEGRNPTDLLDFVADMADKANSRLGPAADPTNLAVAATDAEDGADQDPAPSSSPVRQAQAAAGEPQQHFYAAASLTKQPPIGSSTASSSAALPTRARGSSDSLPAQRGQHSLSPGRASTHTTPLLDPRDAGDPLRLTPQNKDALLSPTRRHAAALGALGALQGGTGQPPPRLSSNGLDHVSSVTAATSPHLPRSSVGVERSSAHVGSMAGSRRREALSSSAEGLGGLLGSNNKGTTGTMPGLPPALNLASPLMLARMPPPSVSTPTPGGPSSPAAGPPQLSQQAERPAPAVPVLGRRAQALQAVFGGAKDGGAALLGSPTSLLDLPGSSPPSSTTQPSPAGDAVGYVPSLLSGSAVKGTSMPGTSASTWWNGSSGAPPPSSMGAAASSLPAARVQARLLQDSSSSSYELGSPTGGGDAYRGRSTSSSGPPLAAPGGSRRERLWGASGGADAHQQAVKLAAAGRRGG